MVGFVLIVVVVVVALMVFLVISLRKPVEMVESVEVENLLNAMMMQTTDCAIVYEPNYADVEDLIKSCYENEKCKNLDKMACVHLNETLAGLMDGVIATEASVSAYQLEVFYQGEIEADEIIKLVWGNCSGEVKGAQRVIKAGAGKIVVRLRFCY